MTNRIALFLAVLIFGFLAVDYARYDWGMTTFTVRKILALIEYLAIWR
jgi:hypothetical protein